MSDRMAKAVVGTVVAVWIVTTVILPLTVKGYTTPPEVSTIMGSIAGAAAAVIFVRRANGNGKGK